jgi:hypothetical protein
MEIIMLMTKSYDYFMKADLGKYEGRWVAIVDDEVVAVSENAGEVVQTAKKKYPSKRPLITKIPKHILIV